MKIAPVMRALRKEPDVEQRLVHTGQHYDPKMSQIFFDDLSIPAPDVMLESRSGSNVDVRSRMFAELKRAFRDLEPDCVVVVGDVDSTIAAALAAVKLGIPCAHIEAGLRSFDRTMREETNRIVTDRVADLLFTPSAESDDNLLAEGIAETSIHRVGNVMIDTLLHHLDRAKKRPALEAFGVAPGGYALATLHRPSNVDDPVALESLLGTMEWIQTHLPVVLPLHPRTRDRLESFSLMARARAMPNLRIAEPLGYLDFIALTAGAKLVLTDSGGLQEETTVLGIPCLTLRTYTERPVTVSVGTNIVVGPDPCAIRDAVTEILSGRAKKGAIPELWDGRASERIASILVDYLRHRPVSEG